MMLRLRNNSSGTIGFAACPLADEERGRTTTARERTRSSTKGEVKPRSPASMAPNVSPPMASDSGDEPDRFERRPRGGGRAGCGWRERWRRIPTGMLMRKISRHETTVSRPPRTGADDEAIAPPIAQIADRPVLAATGSGRPGRSGPSTPASSLPPPSPGRSGRRPAARGPGRDHTPPTRRRSRPTPTMNARRAPTPIAERPRREQQRGEHQRVAVDDPLQPGDPAAEIGPDRRQRER